MSPLSFAKMELMSTLYYDCLTLYYLMKKPANT
jgi:hypothetical protein